MKSPDFFLKWVICGPADESVRCPLARVKRKSLQYAAMSANDPQQTPTTESIHTHGRCSDPFISVRSRGVDPQLRGMLKSRAGTVSSTGIRQLRDQIVPSDGGPCFLSGTHMHHPFFAGMQFCEPMVDLSDPKRIRNAGV